MMDRPPSSPQRERPLLSSEEKPPSEKSSKKRSFSKKRITLFLLKWILIFGIWGAFLTGIGCIWFSYDLPHISEMQLMPRRPSIKIVDRHEAVLATYGDVYGEAIWADNLPPHVTQALLAIEDRRFYSHFGIDILGLVRAAVVNYRAGSVVQGGSTITQQLAKNFLQSKKLYTPQDRSLRRKIQEAILAVWLEYKFTKNQILTMYLNRVYFGGGTFGIDGAALRYFGRHAKDLSIYEAAVLAGLLKAPSRYSPMQNPELAEGRAKQVLLNMVDAGFISQDAMQAALAMASSVSPTPGGNSIRYFTDWIVDTLSHYVNVQDRDLEVITTIDTRLQALAERHMKEVITTQKWKAEQMALVSMTPDGAIQAMVGGINYAASKFNRVTQALRQPGSAFKFFTFLTALENGYLPSSMIDDRPLKIGKWQASNYMHKAQGEISLRDAFAKSVNAVAIRLSVSVGLANLLKTVRRLGITTPMPNNLTIALGSGEVTLLELTGAFSTIAQKGFQTFPHGISQIRDRKGQILYQWKNPYLRIVNPVVAQRMSDIMQAVLTYGSGRSANIGRPAGGKTGTSQEYRDAWLIGLTPELVTGVWSGKDNATPMTRVPGGSPSSHLWKAFMTDALSHTPTHDFPLEEHHPFFSEEKKADSTQEEEHEPGLIDDLMNNLFE